MCKSSRRISIESAPWEMRGLGNTHLSSAQQTDGLIFRRGETEMEFFWGGVSSAALSCILFFGGTVTPHWLEHGHTTEPRIEGAL